MVLKMALEARRKRDAHDRIKISPNLENTKYIKAWKTPQWQSKNKSLLKREIKEQGYTKYL